MLRFRFIGLSNLAGKFFAVRIVKCKSTTLPSSCLLSLTCTCFRFWAREAAPTSCRLPYLSDERVFTLDVPPSTRLFSKLALRIVAANDDFRRKLVSPSPAVRCKTPRDTYCPWQDLLRFSISLWPTFNRLWAGPLL